MIVIVGKVKVKQGSEVIVKVTEGIEKCPGILRRL
jgi:hypothetical protein